MPIGDANIMHESSDIIAADAHASPKGLRDLWYSRGGTVSRRIIAAVIYRLYRLLGEVTAVVLGLTIALLWIAIPVLDKQSTDLTVLRPNIKLWFSQAFDGRDAEFGKLEVTWLPSSDQVVVRIEDAKIYNESGEVLEQFDLIQSTLALDETIFKRPRLIIAEVHGGVLSFLEDEEGRIIAGLGPPTKVGRVGPVYRSGETSAVTSKNDITQLLQGFEFIQISDAELYVRSEKSGIDLRSDVKSLRAAFSNDGDWTLAANGICYQVSGGAPFSLSSVVDQDFENIKMRLKVTGARPDEIAPKKGRFWEFQGLAAPVDLTAEVDFSRIEGLRSAEIEMEVSEGRFTLPREDGTKSYPINSLIARAALAPGEERMDVSQLDLSSPNLSFKSSGFLTELGMLSDGDENSSPLFDFSARNISADMTPRFSAPTQVEKLDLIGHADFDTRQVTIDRGSIRLFNSTHNFSGGISVTEQNQVKNLKFHSTMSGMLTPEELILLWPVNAFEAARQWIDRAILAGQLTKIEAEVNLDESFFDAPALTEDRFQLRFGGDAFDVKYMQSMPMAVGVKGEGALIGNHLGVEFNGGNIGSVAVHSGQVEIPVILPFGGNIIIDAEGGGEISSLMEVANNPPFEIASRYDIEPRDLIGQGDVSIQVIRPLRRVVTAEQLLYEVGGNFTGVTAPFKVGRHEIKNGEIALDINRDRVAMSGPVDIGPWQANLSWEETLGDPSALTQYGLFGTINADVLDELGLASRSWFDGDAAITVRAEGTGLDVKYAELDLELTDAELSIERIWLKPKGQTAHMLAQLRRSSGGGYIIDNSRLTGEGIAVRGRAELDSRLRPRYIDLTEIQIDSLIDSSVQIIPDRDVGRLNIEVDAKYLDVSAWTEDLFAERQSNLDVPVSFFGAVETLVLDRDYRVTQSEFDFSHSGEVIEAANLQALTDGKLLNLELTTRDDKRRQVAVTIPNASKAVAAFIGLNNTTGGNLSIIATLPAAGEDGPIIGDAEMRDFKLTEAPALAQLLSIASLTGLADTLTGGSMQFDRFKLPFTVLGDDIAIRDARLYGPALGMTGNGEVNLDRRVMDFDGTIVPAYTANSFLADIPLIGKLFAQEKGGGLFALTYTVNGPFEKTQIAVNPLSALTPGFLRGIFKRDRSTVDDAIKEAVLDVAPPELEGR